MKYGYAAIALFGLLSMDAPVRAQGDNTSFNWKFEEGNKLMEEKLFNQSGHIKHYLFKMMMSNRIT